MARALRLAELLGRALMLAGFAASAAVAVAGPFGALRTLRYPLLLSALGWGLARLASGRWWQGEKVLGGLRSRRAPLVLTVVASGLFVRIKWLEWKAGMLSGLDFSHLDYAIWSTAQGRFMEIPILPPQNLILDMFGNHYSPVLLLSAVARSIWDSPLASTSVHAVSLAAAALPLHAVATRFVDRATATVMALTYLFCGSVANTLQFEIHQESFFPLGFALVFLGIFSRAPFAYLGAALTLAIKEDAGLYLAPLFFLAALLYRKGRGHWLFLGAISLAYLYFALKVAMPWHQPAGGARTYYIGFWERYGTSYGEVARAMLTHPHWVLRDVVLNSALYKQLLPWGLLPLASPISLAALPPILVLSTATSSLRTFGLYYGIVLVPIFFVASVQVLARFPRNRLAAAAALLALSAFVGGGYLRFPSPSPAFADWASSAQRLAPHLPPTQVTWVTAGLLPYLPYETRWRRLDSLSNLPPPGRDAVLLQRELGGGFVAEPFEQLTAAVEARGYRKVWEEGALRLYR